MLYLVAIIKIRLMMAILDAKWREYYRLDKIVANQSNLYQISHKTSNKAREAYMNGCKQFAHALWIYPQLPCYMDRFTLLIPVRLLRQLTCGFFVRGTLIACMKFGQTSRCGLARA